MLWSSRAARRTDAPTGSLTTNCNKSARRAASHGALQTRQGRASELEERQVRGNHVNANMRSAAMQRNVASDKDNRSKYKASGDLRPFWRPEVNLAVMEAGGD